MLWFPRLRWSTIIAGAALLFSVWVYVANLWAYRGQVFEDSYITFRYAQHLAQGYGLVWNVGDAPTEGFTNLLLVVVVAGFELIHADPLLGTRIVSILGALIVAGLLMKIAITSLRVPLLVAVLAACVWLTFLPTALHTVYGLETLLFTVLLVALVWQTFRCQQNPTTISIGVLLTIGILLLLTRPEGIAYGGLALLWLWAQSGRRVRLLVGASVAYGLIVVAWAGLRFLYFGDWLPNPFLIKTGGSADTLPGLGYVIYFLVDIGLLVPFAVGALFRRQAPLYLCALIAGFGVLFYAFVRHEMGIHHRFLFPTFPFWILLAAGGIMPLLHRGERLLTSPRLVVVQYGALLVAVLLLHPQELIGHEPISVRWARLAFNTPVLPDGAVATNREMGTVLAGIGAGNALVCLNEDAGVMPYVSNCHHIDPVGLNDNTIARTTTLTAYQNYLFGTQPDVMFLRSYDADWNVAREIACPFGSHGKLNDFSRAAIYDDPRFQAFEVVGSVADGWGYYYHIIVRQDSAYYDTLKHAFLGYIEQKQGYILPAHPVSTFEGPCPTRDSTGKGML